MAGLALLGTLASSLAGALTATQGREAAAITFVVAASGISFLGVGAAFWALAAGLAVRALLPRDRSPNHPGRPAENGRAATRA